MEQKPPYWRACKLRTGASKTKELNFILLFFYRVRSFGRIRKRITDPGSLGSWCIKGTEKYFPSVDSSVPLMPFFLPCDHKLQKAYY